MSALVEFSMFPTEKTQSKSAFVARVLDIVDKSGLAYQLTPMGTIIEGDLDIVLDLVRKMHESGFDEKIQRVLTSVTIDDRRDKAATMESKVKSVTSKLYKR